MVNATELIRISPSTKKFLDEIKLTKSETYEEVIQRLIPKHREDNKWI